MLAKHMAQAHTLAVGAQANQVVSACAHAHAETEFFVGKSMAVMLATCPPSRGQVCVIVYVSFFNVL